MPKFSEQSEELLKTCHPYLGIVFEEVIRFFDCKVLAGHRSQEEQEKCFRDGTTTKHWPDSKHNLVPSVAIDVVPYPVNWDLDNPNNLRRWYFFGGLVLGVAWAKGIMLRWGGDWDGDFDFRDQRLYDLPHFELKIS